MGRHEPAGIDDGAAGHGVGHSEEPWRRLMTLLAPERRSVAMVLGFAVGVGVLTLATPVAVQALVNVVAFGGLTQPLVVLGVVLMGFLSLAGAIRVLKAYVVELMQRRVFVRVVTALGERLPRVRAEAVDRGNAAELVNRFFDVMTVQKAGATLLLDVVVVVLQAGLGLLILAFYHPFLLAFDLVLVGGFAVVLFVLGRGAVRTAIAESKAKYAVVASLEEIARNPMTFKLAGGPALAAARADDLAVEWVVARRRHWRVVFRQVVGAVVLQAVAATALLTIGGWLVIQGQLTLGQLVAAELIVSTALASFAKLGHKLESVYDLLAAVDKVGHLLDVPVERTGGDAATGATVDGDGLSVRLQDVWFGYGEPAKARSVLAGLDLDVAAGERVCVVGGNGSGKTTLSEVLWGLRSPARGTVDVGGTDVREMSLDELRRRVAVVTGLEVIEGTVEENVRMGRAGVSAAEARAVLAEVGLLADVRRLPDGMNTRLSATGAPLSYGQARRLMVARAMAGRPGVLVLDDVLDDVDAAGRERLVSALTAAGRGWTVIVLTHNEGTFGGAGVRVVRLEGGGDDADGAELMGVGVSGSDGAGDGRAE